MSPEIERKIEDVKEAFGVRCYWSMAGCFCIEAGSEHVALKPEPGGIWDKLSTAAGDALDAKTVDLTTEVNRLKAFLTAISEGRGRFSRDPYTHACNTIEDMKQLALDALAGMEFEP